MREILRWIQGWSTKKKVLWGIVAGFLFLVCVSALVAEPVEEEDTADTLAVNQSESTDKPQDCRDEEVLKYLTFIYDATDGVGEAFDNAGRLFGELERSPALFVSQDWQDDVKENNEVLQRFVSDVRDTKPPESVQDIHKILLEAVDELEKGISLSGEGAREIDATLIVSALPHLNSYNDKFNEFTKEMFDYCETAEGN